MFRSSVKSQLLNADAAIGVFANAGIYYSINDTINIGADIKYSTAQVNFGEGENVDIGGLHYGLVVSYHF